ncbi:endolytic transglycosylase MltG [Patescibacteria group bacterium]|nr:endolytic transglycosylase MltG [Patescibacteria group bacterium]
MKAIKLIFTFLIVVMLVVAITGGYFLSQFYLKGPSKNTMPVSFEIEKGDSVKKISKELEEKGVIDNVFIFEVYVWLLGLDGVFQPGNYTLKPGTNISKLVKEMTDINTKEKSYTIIEGWNLREFAEYLKNKDLIKEDKGLYGLTGQPAVDYRKNKLDFIGGWDYDFLSDKPPYVGLEGYLYPDTYRILADGNVDSLLRKALDNFDKKLTQILRDEIKLQKKTVFEVLTAASIVEKEVDTYEDRRIVADIILRRLKKGMALQMDSTINYITASGRARSTYEDLKIQSLWNTYKYIGLPLGPICNPSIWSIKAVVYPTPNDYWYFLSDKEGKVYYAKTYAEHLKNRDYME